MKPNPNTKNEIIKDILLEFREEFGDLTISRNGVFAGGQMEIWLASKLQEVERASYEKGYQVARDRYREREALSKTISPCPVCGKRFKPRTDDLSMSCAVLHSPGQCCHYGQLLAQLKGEYHE